MDTDGTRKRIAIDMELAKDESQMVGREGERRSFQIGKSANQ